jgi:hypothetical protein
MDAVASFPEGKKDNVLEILNLIRNETGDTRYTAITELLSYCQNPEFKEILCFNKELNVLDALKELVERLDPEEDGGSLYQVFLCLQLLSLGTDACGVKVASKEFGLFPIFMNKIYSTPNNRQTEAMEMTIANCSRFNGCHAYLLSAEIDWLGYLDQRLTKYPNDFFSHGFLSNLISSMSNEDVKLVLNRGIPRTVLDILISYELDDNFTSASPNENFFTVPGQAIPFTTYLSKSSAGSAFLKEYFDSSKTSSFFFNLLSSSSVLGIYQL